mmetsp:Transcript_10777/g.32342  ORF Transcript_10777/g.32342 Transcript_10777/m.32342 type:complete len:600 (-) Transcript_10777:893-2692(-)
MGSTPRRKSQNGLLKTIANFAGSNGSTPQKLSPEEEKEPFVPSTTGDVFAGANSAKGGGWGSAGAHDAGGRRGWFIWRKKWSILSVLGVFVFAFFRYGGVAPPPQDNDFVKVTGTEFELSCRPWYPAGFNAHHLVSNVLVFAHEHRTPGNKKGRQLVRAALKQASGMGLNVMRIFAHTTDPNFVLQTAPGEYNEKVFKALDFVLVEARRYGLRVILSVLDNWKYSGGIDEFVDWSATSPRRTRERPADKQGDTATHEYDQETKDYEVERHSVFWSDEGCKSLYKNHLKTLVERRNSISGRLYKDDATIFAWDLVNEPRCETWRVPECVDTMPAWISEMAEYLKSLDPNHLVTSGGEGFWGADNPRADDNPQMPASRWATQTGQDFTANTNAKGVDFGGIHVWPDNWEMKQKKFLVKWVTDHMEDSEEHTHKPLLLEEFGKIVWEKDFVKGMIEKKRNPVYDAMTQATLDSVMSGGILRGALFWRWDIQVYLGVGPGEYGVRPDHSTFDIIRNFAGRMRSAVVATPPRKECELGCWVPTVKHHFETCEENMTVCAKYWQDGPAKNGSLESQTPVWPSKEACCQAGGGAYVNGCSAMATFL